MLNKKWKMNNRVLVVSMFDKNVNNVILYIFRLHVKRLSFTYTYKFKHYKYKFERER